MKLKLYQDNVLQTLDKYIKKTLELGDCKEAFEQITKLNSGIEAPYIEIEGLEHIPYVCMRVPTGGGKTLLAASSVGSISRSYLMREKSVILWLVPSDPIKNQTLKSLRDKNSFYREILESSFNSITVLSKEEALQTGVDIYNTSTVIIVTTIQSFRIENEDGRKVYESNGCLQDHFIDLDEDTEKLIEESDETILYSLKNVLRINNPIVVVDEAHNSRTDLSFKTLKHFNPSFIIEFTATPQVKANPSNVLHVVSGIELKDEKMIKHPIILETKQDWKDLVYDAVKMRNKLENDAIKEYNDKFEEKKPIMLIQAQNNSKHKHTITTKVVEDYLINDLGISKNYVIIHTGEEKGLKGIDIKDSPIRYIITVKALQEGWDCPNAYILTTLSNVSSSIATEQLIGRIMRLPDVDLKKIESLNKAYVFAMSSNFIESTNAIRDSLVDFGFERKDTIDFIYNKIGEHQLKINLDESVSQPSMVVSLIKERISESDTNKLDSDILDKVNISCNTKDTSIMLEIKGKLNEEQTKTIKSLFKEESTHKIIDEMVRCINICPENKRIILAPSQQGERFLIPKLMLQQENFLEEFSKYHFIEGPLDLLKCNFEIEEEQFSIKNERGHISKIYLSKEGKIKSEFVGEIENDENTSQIILHDEFIENRELNLVYWLERYLKATDIHPEQMGMYILKVIEYLINKRNIKLEELFINKYKLKIAIEHTINKYRIKRNRECFQLSLLKNEDNFIVDNNNIKIFERDSYHYNQEHTSGHRFKKHFYPKIGDLKNDGEEFRCAQYIDHMEEVKYWIRNVDRKPNSFYLQTSSDKFYPDFIALLKDGRYLVVEYKGEDRISNDDSKEKNMIGKLYEKRSNGKVLFLMITNEEFNKISNKVNSQSR